MSPLNERGRYRLDAPGARARNVAMIALGMTAHWSQLAFTNVNNPKRPERSPKLPETAKAFAVSGSFGAVSGCFVPHKSWMRPERGTSSGGSGEDAMLVLLRKPPEEPSGDRDLDRVTSGPPWTSERFEYGVNGVNGVERIAPCAVTAPRTTRPDVWLNSVGQSSRAGAVSVCCSPRSSSGLVGMGAVTAELK